MDTKITAIKDGIYHVQSTIEKGLRESLLTKYRFIKDDIKENVSGKITGSFCEEKSSVYFQGGKRNLEFILYGKDGGEYDNNGYKIEIPVTEKERFFGLGDETRDSVMKRGSKATIWIINEISYGPVPFMISTDGWGVLINSTYKNEFDIASDVKDKVTLSSSKGIIDFYVFFGDSMMDIVKLYTDLTGRPVMLPRSAYGLTFVNNEEVGARDALMNAHMFRKEDYPCDIMGFEPEWMETHYDYSPNKRWNREKFYIPFWREEETADKTFFGFNLKRMGFRYTLWLCCDWDLLWKEEGRTMEYKNYEYKGVTIKDVNFSGDVIMDMVTKPGEDWFDHLEKYVRQGACGFKLDGAMQVVPHPDRLWAGRYFDDEVHNVYPVIYARQMYEGFKNCENNRPLIYTPCFYVGTQGFAATWAGDLGGGDDIPVYIMNMAFCGHSNASCDMDMENPFSIHFCFLLPWTQAFSWRYWQEPWFMGEETEEQFMFYDKLRSSLFPYLYSMAYTAYKNGIPVARPLPLIYEETDRYDGVKNAYMLGDSFLVGVFDMNLDLPSGKWYDYFTGEFYEGDQKIEYNIPSGKGGALFLKEGSVFVTQKPKKYLDKKVPSNYKIEVFPGDDCEFTLCEDDGITMQYEDGNVAITKITLNKVSADEYILTVGKRFMENDLYEDIGEKTGFDVVIYNNRLPREIILEGEKVEFLQGERSSVSFRIPKELHEEKEVKCQVCY